MGRGEVAEEDGGVTDGVLAVTDIGVPIMERESLVAGEGGEARRVGSMAVVASEMV